MSYDVCLLWDGGRNLEFSNIHEWIKVAMFSNYTYNVYEMLLEAGIELCSLTGKTAAEAADVIERGLKLMYENPKRFIALNPPNGWGSYDTLIPWLEDIVKECRRMPIARFLAH